MAPRVLGNFASALTQIANVYPFVVCSPLFPTDFKVRVLGGGHWPQVPGHSFQRVISPPAGLVRRVDIDEPVPLSIRDICVDALYEVPVGIDEGHSPPLADILRKHCFEQGCLARAGLTDDIDVRQAVLLSNAKGDVAVSEIGLSQVRDVGIHGSDYRTLADARKAGRLDRIR